MYLHRFISKTVSKFIKFSHLQTSIQASATVRCLCSKPLKDSLSQNSTESTKVQKWIPIYSFPFIRLAGFVNRLKLFQSVFTIVSLPVSVGLYYYDICDVTTVTIVMGSALFTCFSLYIITSFFKRLIGIIYITEDNKSLKIGHLTFWGNRKDIIVPVEDIIPLTDGICNAKDAFVKLHRYDSEDILYLTLRFGKIQNKNIFQNIFGSFEILGLK